MKEDKLIVGVFGTQCVGKSTFIDDVIVNTSLREDERLRWVRFGDDYRQIIADKGLKINRNGSEECQQVIHDTLVSNTQKAITENYYKRIIMDRTVIDSFAYTFWLFAYGGVNINPTTLEVMWNQVARYTKCFDALVYIPLEKCNDVVVVDDKFRDTNVEYRKQMDTIMKNIWLTLGQYGCNINVVYGSRENRVRDFIQSIEYLMENKCSAVNFPTIKEFTARDLLSR